MTRVLAMAAIETYGLLTGALAPSTADFETGAPPIRSSVPAVGGASAWRRVTWHGHPGRFSLPVGFRVQRPWSAGHLGDARPDSREDASDRAV